LPGQLPGGAVRGAPQSKSGIDSGRDQNALAVQRDSRRSNAVLDEHDVVVVIFAALDNLRGDPKRPQLCAQHLSEIGQAIEAALDVNPWCRRNRQRRHSGCFPYLQDEFSERHAVSPAAVSKLALTS